IGLVDTHSKGIRSDDHTYHVGFPVLLSPAPFGPRQSSVIKRGRYARVNQHTGGLLGFTSVPNADDPASTPLASNTQPRTRLVLLSDRPVGPVFALQA